MNKVVTKQVSPFAELKATNPYLPKNSVLCDWQEKQLELFLQRGFPTKREELWKYTDVSALMKQSFSWAKQQKAFLSRKKVDNCVSMVFVDGYFSEELSDLSLLPKEVMLCPNNVILSEAKDLCSLQRSFAGAQDDGTHPFAILNSALMTDGIFLSIPKNITLSTPIHCVFITTQNNILTCPRHIIHASRNSEITIIEEYISDSAENYFTNAVTNIHAEENAKVHHYKIQSEHLSATHIANIFVQQKQDSVVKCFNLATGSHLAREDVLVKQDASYSECHLNGFYYLHHAGQHIDNHLHVDHIAAHGFSTMLYKGILDKKSRAVFNGKVYVHKDAQKINAQQANHNLLLSQEAEIDTKPELEIYADDIKCSHGATIGQLNSEALFYLRARGIDEQQAIAMLTHAFADDVFNKVENPTIKHYLQLQAGHYVA